jgi:hypothetical protein
MDRINQIPIRVQRAGEHLSRSATKAHREHARVLFFKSILGCTGKPAKKQACPWHPASVKN